VYLRIFSLIVAIICPPLSAILWQGSRLSTQINFVVWCVAIGIFFYISTAGGILIHLLVVLHTFLLVIFCKNNGIFNDMALNKGVPFLHLGIAFFALILTTIIFQQRINTEQSMMFDSEAIAHGKELFSTCTVCHTMHKNFVGPHLAEIYGRKAGSLTSYNYSGSLAQANFYWTSENLIQFLQNPNEFLPGTRMAITPLSRKDASDIAIYLESN
jgi:cytochrome c